MKNPRLAASTTENLVDPEIGALRQAFLTQIYRPFVRLYQLVYQEHSIKIKRKRLDIQSCQKKRIHKRLSECTYYEKATAFPITIASRDKPGRRTPQCPATSQQPFEFNHYGEWTKRSKY
jgi:hypothetical protein